MATASMLKAGKSIRNVVFFGTDNFAIPSLRSLHKCLSKSTTGESLIEKLTVVTPPDAPSGRNLKTLKPAPIKIEAQKLNLEVLHPSSKKLGSWELPASEKYDLAVAVSFGAFIPDKILSRFAFGGINIHPSLLPQYRGAAPIIHSLFNGDATTGVTIQEISPRAFDAGRILKQETIVLEQEAYLTVHDRLAKLGASMLEDTIANWCDIKEGSWEQDLARVSNAHKLDRSYSFIDWEFDSPNTIFKRERALSWKYPLSTYFRGQPISFFGTALVVIQRQPFSGNVAPAPGTMFFSEDRNYMFVQTSSPYHCLSVSKVRVGSRSPVKIKDFFNGYQLKCGQESLATKLTTSK